MVKGGFIIRLIDVVFILLFGFISISEIGTQRSIDPPKSTELLKPATQKNKIFIGITSNGQFIIELLDGTTGVLKDVSQIKELLQKIALQNPPKKSAIKVQIVSNWDSPIKYTMQVADICDKLGLRKALLVRKIEKIKF